MLPDSCYFSSIIKDEPVISSGCCNSSSLSIVGENASRAFIYSTAGVYVIHPSGDHIVATFAGAAKQRFSSTVNAPVEVDDAVLALALEDNTTDSSPYANTMTATGSPGTVAAVFGNGYDGGAGKYLSHVNDADFNIAANTGIYAQYWMKADTDDANDTHFQLDINGGAPYFYVVFDGDGTMSGEYRDSASINASCASTGDLSDGEWHHIAAVWDGVNVFRLYTDGIENCNDTGAATAATAFEDLFIGTNGGITGRTFDGSIDDFSMGHGQLHAEAVAKIHAEGRKKLGMGTPVFTRTTDDALLSNNVVEVDALDNGMWAVAFSDANTVQVFDGRIPLQQIAAPAGTVKSLALIQSPGTDSVGVAIGTSTNLKFVQPAVNLREAMAHEYKEPIHVGSPVVVDSAGLGGIFWTGTDAVNAAGNAGRNHVYVQNGQYGPVDIAVHYMHFECSGAKNDLADLGAAFVGGGSDEALDVTTGVVQINNCSFYTAPGGAGGGYSAVSIIGNNNMFHDNVIIDADLSGIVLHGNKHNVYDNLVMGADGYGIVSEPGGDNAKIDDNFVQGTGSDAIVLNANAENNVVVGNITDAAITDNSGTSTVVGNEQF